MTTTVKVLGATALATATLAGGVIAADQLSSTPTATVTATLVTVPYVYDPATQYIGVCGDVVSPPAGGACEAVQGLIRYAMLGALVNAKPFQNWRKGAPVDSARVDAWLAAPSCPNPSLAPNPPLPTTFMGQAIVNAIQAYACAKGVGPIAWPAPNPPPAAGSSDKTAPTPPSGLQVSPSG